MASSECEADIFVDMREFEESKLFVSLHSPCDGWIFVMLERWNSQRSLLEHSHLHYSVHVTGLVALPH